MKEPPKAYVLSKNHLKNSGNENFKTGKMASKNDPREHKGPAKNHYRKKLASYKLFQKKNENSKKVVRTKLWRLLQNTNSEFKSSHVNLWCTHASCVILTTVTKNTSIKNTTTETKNPKTSKSLKVTPKNHLKLLNKHQKIDKKSQPITIFTPKATKNSGILTTATLAVFLTNPPIFNCLKAYTHAYMHKFYIMHILLHIF